MLQLPPVPGSEAAALHGEINRSCLAMLERARKEGLLDSNADLDWAGRVYYVFIGETLHGRPWDPADPDALDARIVETLLHDFASRR